MAGELLTTFEVAQRLKVSVYYVRQQIRQGRLRAIRVGKGWKVKEDDLALFLASFSDSPLVRTTKQGNDA
ncbi:helix-turn-helix domain-containing protein [Thermus caldifontis]|uniref:helix-turn-helix domain-containing protein n=1 Tax=Thermus caldifontis TaxID=1930763 RepID=UPI000DF11D94|nr:helix-turn-helix domain-containing protein [Thermus caldifontis]